MDMETKSFHAKKEIGNPPHFVLHGSVCEKLPQLAITSYTAAGWEEFSHYVQTPKNEKKAPPFISYLLSHAYGIPANAFG